MREVRMMCRAIAVRLAKEAVFLMLAGTDNTAYTLLRAVMLLAEHPQWLRAMADEQTRLVAENGDTINKQVHPACCGYAGARCTHPLTAQHHLVATIGK
jgi:cytochrome P450